MRGRQKATIFYRTYSGENEAPRPGWYSKELCLKSILIAFEILNREIPSRFNLLFDGFVTPDDKWSQNIKKILGSVGTVKENPRRGNCGSVINSIHEAAQLQDDEVVVIAEDDYLWLPQSLIELYRSLTELPVDYSTPYDHPVRYQPNYLGGADYPHTNNTIYITQTTHWRTQESTCMTFATTPKILREDMEYFNKYKDNGKGRPEDRELFREIQGLGSYRYKDLRHPRTLIGPMPSLATHAHLPWLAPCVDWDVAAEKINLNDQCNP